MTEHQYPEKAFFVIRPAQGHEVMEGDPRSLILQVGRGNSSYLFALSQDEADDLRACLERFHV